MGKEGGGGGNAAAKVGKKFVNPMADMVMAGGEEAVTVGAAQGTKLGKAAVSAGAAAAKGAIAGVQETSKSEAAKAGNVSTLRPSLPTQDTLLCAVCSIPASPRDTPQNTPQTCAVLNTLCSRLVWQRPILGQAQQMVISKPASPPEIRLKKLTGLDRHADCGRSVGVLAEHSSVRDAGVWTAGVPLQYNGGGRHCCHVPVAEPA